MSLETVIENRMESDKFHLLLDVLKILEKHDDPEVRQSAVEIIDNYNEGMSSEQKAAMLKEFLNFNSRAEDIERKRRFDEELRKQQMGDFFRGVKYD